jgi:glycosyltransferase involved in cell wall biosynthesis
MRIAQISPLIESVPPRLYGGTERMVHYLTEELVRQGHRVTLFASGDSRTSAELDPGWHRALRLGGAAEPNAHHLLMLEKAFRRRGDFDVMHFHLDYTAFPLMRRHPEIPAVATMHGRMDLPELDPLYREFRDIPVVSISMSQREPVPWANWIGNVPHGLPPDLYGFHPGPGRYLAFLGRMSPEKRPDLAVSIAVKSGYPLKMAAKVDKADQEYFHDRIEPLLGHPLVEYIGEIGEGEKGEFLGNAIALLFPVDWPEPFGLVMIEAMACGTPVIATPRGSVPEIVRQGVSGFVVADEEEAVDAVERARRLDRAACRAHFEERFAAGRMARDYLGIYSKAMEAASAGPGRDWGSYGGSNQHWGQILHNGQLLAGRKAEPGPETRRNLRGF